MWFGGQTSQHARDPLQTTLQLRIVSRQGLKGGAVTPGPRTRQHHSWNAFGSIQALQGSKSELLKVLVFALGCVRLSPSSLTAPQLSHSGRSRCVGLGLLQIADI